MKRATILLFISLLFCLHIDAEENVNDRANLRYEIIKKEFRTDKYITVTARVVIQGDNLTKDIIQKALNQIIAEIRKQDNPDTILVYGYKEKEDAMRAAHDFTGFVSLAWAIWRPQGKGNRLYPTNEKNIQNKESYETTFDVPEQKEIPDEIIVTKFDKKTRKKIFYEFDEADHQAFKEAQKYFPADDLGDWNNIMDPVFQKKFSENKSKEEQILKKFRKQIMNKYKLAENEVENIETEARLDRWPQTNHYYLYDHTWKEDYGKMADN